MRVMDYAFRPYTDPNGPFGHGGLQCEACHGPGGAHVQAGGGPRRPDANVPYRTELAIAAIYPQCWRIPEGPVVRGSKSKRGEKNGIS